MPVLVSRDGWLRTLDVTLAPPIPTEAKLVPLPKPRSPPATSTKVDERSLPDPTAKPPPESSALPGAGDRPIPDAHRTPRTPYPS